MTLPYSRPSFIANILGVKTEIFLSMDNSLWHWVSYDDAWKYDLQPGQNTIASTPHTCREFVRAHVPHGPVRDRWMEYFSWLDFSAYQEDYRERERLVTEYYEARFKADKELAHERAEREWEELYSGNSDNPHDSQESPGPP